MDAQKLQVTKDEWKRMHRDYRTGDPRKGTAKVLRFVESSRWTR